MCGIAGVFCFDPLRVIQEKMVRHMADTMVHRGPDDSGIRIGPGYGLGHRRLSIIDLEGGHQPIGSEDLRSWIVVNGEIYNYRDLVPELESAGHVFRTVSDSEVALHGQEEWGREAVTKLHGMFAYALVEEQAQRLTLVRDCLGIKPLYWAEYDGCLLFASEIKAILAYPGFERRLNEAAITSYLNFRYVVGGQTFFKGILEVPPGHRLVATRGNVSIESFWEIPHEKVLEDRGERFYVESIGEVFNSAVRYRMISDVPVGAYLSGGVDSSLIVASMSGNTKEPIKTYSIGFAESGYHEFEYAQMVASRYRTAHREIVLSGNEYFDLLPQLIRFKDAPLGVPNEVPLWQMSRILKEEITVVLSGEGADELFGGYGRIFRAVDDYERMVAGVSGDMERTLVESYGRVDFNDPVDFFLHRYGYFGKSYFDSLLNAEFRRELEVQQYPRSVFEEAFEYVSDISLRRRFFWVFQRHHLPGLLQRLDTTTMATGVEGRVPFVDHRLVELGHRTPEHYKLHWKSKKDERQAQTLAADQISEVHDTPKWILRQVARNALPEPVLSRRKVGFPVPLGEWLGGRLRSEVRNRLLDAGAATRGFVNDQAVTAFVEHDKERSWADGMRMWMLLNLEIFLSEYFGDTSQAQVWSLD